jgi:hypothetical protein
MSAFGRKSRRQGACPSYVAVSPEVLQQLDLAQGTLGQDLLAKDIGDLLDGDTLVGMVIDGGTKRRSKL